MILPIIKVGGGPNISELTAGPGDVLAAEKFIGAGSENPQEGVIVQRGSPEYSFPINGTQKLPPGYYAGGRVRQNIETMASQSVGPGARMITIPTAGKYMTGDITIRAVKNLSTSVIKKGQYVGGVGPGTWEGYINKDPKVPYYYGAFNGIQSVSVFPFDINGRLGDFSLQRDHMAVYVKNNIYYTTVVFNKPIDLTGLTRMLIRIEHNISARFDARLYRNKVTNYIYDDTSGKSKLNPDIGDYLGGVSTLSGTAGDLTADVSSISGEAYLYLNFTDPGNSTSGTLSKVYIVKFE